MEIYKQCFVKVYPVILNPSQSEPRAPNGWLQMDLKIIKKKNNTISVTKNQTYPAFILYTEYSFSFLIELTCC